MEGKIKQYRPAFFSGFENEIKSFNSLAELLALDFVANFKLEHLKDISESVFHKYSLSRSAGGSEFPHVLLAEYDKGYSWWVVGYINDTEIIKELPIWKPKYKNKKTAQ